MQRYNSFVMSIVAILALIYSAGSASAAADPSVCSRGLGEPPFLATGVDSNLLLLLDNSGSMLDMAYTKPTPTSTNTNKQANQCFDDTFISYNASDTNPSVYAGNYNRLIPVDPPAVATDTAWYKWVDQPNSSTTLSPWTADTDYLANALVYTNGVIYRAVAEGRSSTGNNIYGDSGVIWERLLQPYWRKNKDYRALTFVVSPATLNVYYNATAGTSSNSATVTSPEGDLSALGWTRVSPWAAGKSYTVNTYVLSKNSIYKSTSGGTSAGDSPDNDSGVSWVEVDPLAWKSGVLYKIDDIVTYRGMIYKALQSSHTAAGLTLYEDNPSGANWTRIDEGYYEMVNPTTTKTSQTVAQEVCDAAASVSGATKYSHSDLCIVKAGTPERMTAFVATGNLLNWLMSSKFDIEKTILTGGKYASGSTSVDGRLISENRGCSGSRFVKEVPVRNSSGTLNYLTMAVLGPRSDGDPMRDGRVDSSDDTARVEVLAVTLEGYNATECQEAVDKVTKKLQGSQEAIDQCLGSIDSSNDVVEQGRVALNHALQTCWQNTGDDPLTHLQTNIDDCADLYDLVTAADIPPYSPAYNCYGYYDPTVKHSDRLGYLGRCWGGKCNPTKVASPAGCDDSNPCVFTSGLLLLRNTMDSDGNVVTTERCTNLNNAGTDCQPNKWAVYFTDDITHVLCDPTHDPTRGWSSEIDPATAGTNNDSTGTIAIPSNLNNLKYNNVALDEQSYACVSAAMQDFCSDIKAPQVIDASDQTVSANVDVGNLPAQLVDLGVLNQLGVDVPLAVMKGYALQQSQPVGIIQQNSENLRIGAMAFNKVGSTTECEQATTTDKVERYCPAGNKDGAHVISPIRLGTQVDDKGTSTTADDRLHVEDVAEAVNLVQATAWTPLAEAMYNAIGYYTQNTDFRLNPNTAQSLDLGDFQTDKDVFKGWEAGKIYTPGSYIFDSNVLYQTILGGTSVGTNRTTDTGVIWSEVGTYKGDWGSGKTYPKNSIVRSRYSAASTSYKLFFTASGGISDEKDGAPFVSTHFDEGILWEPLLDPVVYPCQENHILVITEGASTADINDQINNFIEGNQTLKGLGSDLPDGICTTDGLLGSTYLDNLTYFARDEKDEFAVYSPDNATLPSSDAPFEEQPKNNLTTHIVVAGSLRNSGTGECNPAILMQNAAANGGTEKPVLGESPAQLEEQLTEIFNELRQRASAGSAASVISSARGGEGAIYQAIFWPELVRQDATNKEYKVAWAGDVHGLFLDENGYMYEDTNHDRALKPTEDLDNDNHFDIGEHKVDAGKIVQGTDLNGDGKFSKTEDLNGNGIFDKTSSPLTTEDLDGDGHFDNVYEDVDGDGTWEHDNTRDKRVIIFFDKDQQKSRACYNTSILQSLGVSCTKAVDLEQVKFLWSANDWLSDYPLDSTGAHSLDTLITDLNRADHISKIRNRYIFTWNDLDNDGIVDSGTEIKELVESLNGTGWDSLAKDFDAANGIEVNNIISWLRGEDAPDLRTRGTVLPSDTSKTYTWRLGDIIHSTPQTVAAPAEGYHLLYNDRSYAHFVAQYKKRRHVVYFGANDGMIHAVNAGFYSDIDKKFCLKKPQANGTCPTDDGTDITADYPAGAPDLGAELWAYVPYNLQPHLKCLLSPLYSHKYFVDLKPRVFDAQIFKPDVDHPFGWGTILVGGMRFGGAPVNAAEINPDTSNGRQLRQFISSYFIMDITNPENKPVLLGEMTQNLDASGNAQWVDLGYSTVIPTMVIDKSRPVGETDTTDKTIDKNRWYLVFGSGPHGPQQEGLTPVRMRGVSDQQAKVSVLPLGGVVKSTTATDGVLDSDGLVGSDNLPRKSMRIDKGLPTAVSSSPTPGTFPLPILPPNTNKAFVSDPITVDFDINPSNNGQYVSDAVYFGTVEGEFGEYPEGTPYWKGGGHLYRLVMNGNGHEVGKDDFVLPDSWKIKPLLDLSSKTDGTSTVNGNPVQPITAAPSVGTDGHNYWIYFGTGRFFDPDDKTDRQQQSYYGIKEPMNSTGTLTWAEVELTGTGSELPGGKGLLQVDEILAQEFNSGSAPLACRNNATGELSTTSKACLPATDIDTFDELESYIAGTGTCSGTTVGNNCVDGWYRNFYPYQNRERNVGQATLLGGLVTFTTYQPFNDVCRAEGNSYLYAVYYKTGTSWYENVFGAYGLDKYSGVNYVKNSLSLGRGLTTTPNIFVGSGGGDEVKAFVQTSTGEIKEIKQENLPVKTYKTGRARWKDYQRP